MANAVFNSFESYLSKDSYNKCEHTTFDLSHIVNLTATYGALIPFYIEDVLPTDRFRIKNIIKAQALPMANPLFNNIRLSTWYFFTPYQVLWHKFHRFIDGGKDGTYTAELPYVRAKFSRNSLGDYLGFPIFSETGNDNFKVSAFPFAAYQAIYKHYFLNEDLQTSFASTVKGYNLNDVWFPADDNKFSLHDGQCWIMDEDDTEQLSEQNTKFDSGSGNNQIDSTFTTNHYDKLPSLTLLRFKNFQKDYFTSAMFSPQRGPAQGVPVSSTQNPFKASDFDDLIRPLSSSDDFTSTQLGFVSSATSPVSSDPDHPTVPLRLGLSRASTVGNITFSDVYSQSNVNRFSQFNSASSSDSQLLSNVKANLADFFNKLASRQGSTAFTISDLMVASQIELWLQRNMQVKSQYDDFLKVHFGDAPYDENIHKPRYIGGTTQLINVSQVVQQSASVSGGTPQGTAVGRADSFKSDYVGTYTCNDYGIIMGIMCIMPEEYYTNGLDKKWTKTSRFDYVMPEFAQLPPEPIYNYEIYANDPASATSQRVFGYSGRYDNYRHRRNVSLADLRNPNMADFYSWNITREFSNVPSLQDNVFICTNKLMGTFSLPPLDSTLNVRMDHFPTANTVNPFIIQIGLDIAATRPLPYRNEPQTLNLRRG